MTQFRRRLAAEMRAQTGHDFTIFQDREDIAWGENWRDVIDGALEAVALLLVIITPGLFRSEASRGEINRFLQRERQLGRSDLILPVYYITAREIEAPAAQRADPLAKVLTSRQYVDWRNMRFEPVTSPLALRTIADLAARMTSAFWRSPPLSPLPPPPQLPPSPPSLVQPGSGDGWLPRPAAGPTFQPAGEPDPYAWLARNDQQGSNQEWIPLHQRSWRQPSQPFRRPTGSQAAPAQVPPAQVPAPPVRELTPGAGAVPVPSGPLPSGEPASAGRGPSDEPAVKLAAGGQGASPDGGGLTQPTALVALGASFFRSHRLTVLASATLAVVLAVTATVYTLVSPGSSAASQGHGSGTTGSGTTGSRTTGSGTTGVAAAARLAATLTVPGGSTVDTVWISPDGKFIAAARTFATSDIYVWNTADPNHPVTLTAPKMEIGGSLYPTMIENIAFSADDTAMTAIIYPQQRMSSASYALFQWNLATDQTEPRWHVLQTPSNISFSSDNTTAVESVKGAVEVVHLPPSQGKASTLTIPDGSTLSYGTSYDVDLTGTRMLYSPAEDTYDVWDFREGKVVNTLKSNGITFLSPDGSTALVSYYGAKTETLSPVPDLVNVDTLAKLTPGDPRWEDQLVSSSATTAYATYSTDGTVIATERAGGMTDLWSSAAGKYLLTIADPTYAVDSDYAVVGPEGHEAVIFGDKAASGDHQFHQLDVWVTRLG